MVAQSPLWDKLKLDSSLGTLYLQKNIPLFSNFAKTIIGNWIDVHVNWFMLGLCCKVNNAIIYISNKAQRYKVA